MRPSRRHPPRCRVLQAHPLFTASISIASRVPYLQHATRCRVLQAHPRMRLSCRLRRLPLDIQPRASSASSTQGRAQHKSESSLKPSASFLASASSNATSIQERIQPSPDTETWTPAAGLRGAQASLERGAGTLKHAMRSSIDTARCVGGEATRLSN